MAKLLELRDAEPEAETLGLRLELASAPGEDFRYDLSFDEFLSAAFTDEVRSHDGLKQYVALRRPAPVPYCSPLSTAVGRGRGWGFPVI